MGTRLQRSVLWWMFLVVFCFIMISVVSRFLSWELKQIMYPRLRMNDSRIDFLISQPPSVTSTSADSKEVRVLKELITWPEPPGTPNFTSSTSAQTSDFRILHPKFNYSIGETLQVFLMARDHQKRPKTYGGDFLQAKLHSPQLKAGITGSVTDHHNGTYTVTFLLPWPGDVEISIRLVHSSEAVHILKRLRDTRPDQDYFHGYFQMNGITEVVECNVEIKNRPVCEYLDPRTGEKWVCVRPKRLPCSAYVYHSTGGRRRVATQKEEAFLKQPLKKQMVPGNISPLRVHYGNSSLSKAQTRKCTPGLAAQQPSGFYYNDIWTSLVCKSKRFHTPPEARACLKRKIIYMFGDSTLRQWWEYLLDFIPSVKQIDLHVIHHSGPLLAVDLDNGFLMQYRAHGKPLKTQMMMAANNHYMANDIAGIGGGPDVIIALTAWAHFVSFPVEVYIRRLRTIRTAVTELLQRSPQTTVIIKTPNTGQEYDYGTDWLSFQLDMILRKMFSDLPVAMVDAWDMTSCHYLINDIHPGKTVIQNEVDMFLSFICPH